MNIEIMLDANGVHIFNWDIAPTEPYEVRFPVDDEFAGVALQIELARALIHAGHDPLITERRCSTCHALITHGGYCEAHRPALIENAGDW